MSCVVYTNDGPYYGSIEISGTTCAGNTGFFTVNFGDSICMDTSQPLFTCDYFKIEGICPSPTPTNSPTPSTTPNACERFRVDFNGIPSAYYSLYQPYTPGYTSWNGLTGITASCALVCSATSAGTQYAVYRNETNPNYFAIYSEQVGKFRFWQFPTFSSGCGFSWTCGGVLYGEIPTGFTYNGLVHPSSGTFTPGPGSNTGIITGITYDNCYPIVTQTMTPSNSPTVTPTITSSPTSTINPICPEQITLSQGDALTSSAYTEFHGTYDRLHTYTGGTLYSAAYNQTTQVALINTADANGFYAATYGRFDGTNYYTIWASYPPPPFAQVIDSFAVSKSTSGYLWDVYYTITTGNTVGIGTFITSGNYKFPITGTTSLQNFYKSYPTICPTSTPTNSPTPSITASNTPTPQVSSTPTNTPTVTTTMTPSPTSNGCLCYLFQNEDSAQSSIFYTPCGGSSTSEVLNGGQAVRRCIDPIAETPSYTGGVTTIVPCSSATSCNDDGDCTGCS